MLDELANHSWTLQNDWLTVDESKNMYEFAQILRKKNALHSAGIAGIGKESIQNTELRGDSIFWLPSQFELNNFDKNEQNFFSAWQSIQMKILNLQHLLNQKLYLGLNHFESQLAVYPIGSFYKKHLDQRAISPHKLNLLAQNSSLIRGTSRRVISLVIYLNFDWLEEDGGELCLDVPGNVRILPYSGRAVIFLSDQVWHEVLPAKKERWSLTTWFHTN